MTVEGRFLSRSFHHDVRDKLLIKLVTTTNIRKISRTARRLWTKAGLLAFLTLRPLLSVIKKLFIHQQSNTSVYEVFIVDEQHQTATEKILSSVWHCLMFNCSHQLKATYIVRLKTVVHYWSIFNLNMSKHCSLLLNSGRSDSSW